MPLNTAEKSAAKPSSREPAIHIRESDYDRIADMALRLEHSLPELSKLIFEEIDRARLHPDHSLPKDVVALNSEVEFIDTATQARRRIKLVMPGEAALTEACISVMTPIGAGLIGMRESAEINWPCPDGRPRTLKILEVTQKP